MSARQEADTLAWDQSDDLWDEGVKKARLSSTCRKIEALAAKVLEKPATYFTPLVMGAFNILYPIRTESPDNSSEMNVLVRLPSVGRRVFPEEKTLAEAATALCTSQRTSLPVPEVINYDIDPDIGPFMIIQDLGSRRTLGAGLYHSSEELSMYRTDNSENKLKHLYEKMAPLVLQLAQPTFPVIGALLETSPGSFHVLARPISFNMSDMVLHSNVPKSIFPPQGTTFQTANEWYTALAEMHIATLLFQHNDMVESEDDCKTKYVARQLFRRLAKQKRLSSFGCADDNWSIQPNGSHGTLPAPESSGPFRLWSDDFRPANVLVDEKDNVLAAIDWEFA